MAEDMLILDWLTLAQYVPKVGGGNLGGDSGVWATDVGEVNDDDGGGDNGDDDIIMAP